MDGTPVHETELCMCCVQGVTWQLTGGVVKNIVPAIASTNAIVAAACALEALKLLTVCSSGIENYMMCAPPNAILLHALVLFCRASDREVF